MKNILLTSAICCVLALTANGQRSVDDLPRSQAAALQGYLAGHADVHFLQEIVLDDDVLREMRRYIRRGMKPYYVAGDFNRDRRMDFAIILTRGKVSAFANTEEAAARSTDIDLRLVVFNGTRRGFVVAHTEEIEAPLTCFVNVQDKQLYFGVFESDADTFILSPAGKGYIMEFEKTR